METTHIISIISSIGGTLAVSFMGAVCKWLSVKGKKTRYRNAWAFLNSMADESDKIKSEKLEEMKRDFEELKRKYGVE